MPPLQQQSAPPHTIHNKCKQSKHHHRIHRDDGMNRQNLFFSSSHYSFSYSSFFSFLFTLFIYVCMYISFTPCPPPSYRLLLLLLLLSPSRLVPPDFMYCSRRVLNATLFFAFLFSSLFSFRRRRRCRCRAGSESAQPTSTTNPIVNGPNSVVSSVLFSLGRVLVQAAGHKREGARAKKACAEGGCAGPKWILRFFDGLATTSVMAAIAIEMVPIWLGSSLPHTHTHTLYIHSHPHAYTLQSPASHLEYTGLQGAAKRGEKGGSVRDSNSIVNLSPSLSLSISISLSRSFLPLFFSPLPFFSPFPPSFCCIFF